MSEFDLINQYFKSASHQRDDVILGIGDDCALLSPPPGKQLAVSTDTLISGVHFPHNTSAADIGYKSLAVNLSDLAAMGAEPAWVSLAISLPENDPVWLKEFMSGFTELAEQYQVALIGGDTTRGPLSITINVTGFIEPGKALKRSQAKAGDIIFVTGTLGDAGVGLAAVFSNSPLDKNISFCLNRLNRPQPRLLAGQLLSHYPVAAIDISDGLSADLQHICDASQTGARVYVEQLPLSDALLACYNFQPDWQKIITAGDDYELCFTCPKNAVTQMTQSLRSHDIQLTQIGQMTSVAGIKFVKDDAAEMQIKHTGYNHFQNEK